MCWARAIERKSGSLTCLGRSSPLRCFGALNTVSIGAMWSSLLACT